MTGDSPPRRDSALLYRPLPPEVSAVLSSVERLNIDMALRMNREPAKTFWTWCQRAIGQMWIKLVTSKLLQVHGLEHVEEATRRGALLLVANHRTYFDMFIVSSVLHRELPNRTRLYFPVIGQYYYQSLTGLALNQFFAFWSMFPPLFALPTHSVSDKYALDLLVELCTHGPGTILGIHPEGGRNLNPDPYSFMRFQPGTGKIIHAARPMVIPTFVAGLDNHVGRQVVRNFTGGEAIRIWFDRPMDLRELLARPAKGSTYKLITDAVMARVAALGADDRNRYAARATSETEAAHSAEV